MAKGQKPAPHRAPKNVVKPSKAQPRTPKQRAPTPKPALNGQSALQKPPPAKPAMRSLTTEPVTLKRHLLDAWTRTVLGSARIPKALKDEGASPQRLIRALVRQERAVMEELWQVFTQERGRLSKHLLSPKRQAVGYLLGFHLANAARAQLLLDRLDSRYDLTSLLAHRSITLWDMGCGTGAIAQTLALGLHAMGAVEGALSVHLLDASDTLLDLARASLEHLDIGLNISATKARLEAFTPQPAPDALNIYSFGYVWNELARNATARTRLLANLHSHAERGEDALICLLEPAQQQLARDAQALRDELAAKGYRLLYPCPGSMPCPMLERTRDWCYSEGLWDRPPAQADIDQLLGIDRSHLASALYVFATPTAQAKLHPRSRATAPDANPSSRVVVGRPKRQTTFDYLICTTTGLKKLPRPAVNAPQGRPVWRGELVNR